MSSGNALSLEITRHVRDTCLCLHLQRAARAVARHFDDAMRPLGLTNGQFSLLMSLNRAQAPSIGAVSALLAMDRTTLTANLKPLQRRGLIEVTVGDADKRRRRLNLTLAGRILLAAALPVWQREHAAIERRLAEADPDRLRADLRALSGGPAGPSAGHGRYAGPDSGFSAPSAAETGGVLPGCVSPA